MNSRLGSQIRDHTPARDHTLREILEGLSAPQKRLPPKLLYDKRGSELFEQICTLEEYYPTRTELGIMHKHGAKIAQAAGHDCLLIEYGSGSSLKTRVLLEELLEPVGYVPIDISISALEAPARELATRFPKLPILPVCADYTASYSIPSTPRTAKRRLIYFPGSTIGNLEPQDALDFLKHMKLQAGENGRILIGADLHKDARILEAAYNDASGVTAEFEMNVLEHINREFGAEFALERFEYLSFYNESLRRIEMYLVSREAQTVRIGGTEIRLEHGERILTECSHKFSPEDFAALANEAGLQVEETWTDENEFFGVSFLRASHNPS